ncbi:hypothetical protein OG365_07110 [Streptomyces sp. NBC_00853]|uniref:hypothetical protein n=1 Tax=Streptomyces TaxID=1883 RepID=UPI00379829D1|nr:hypothetical protein OG365_07110 [Streptomyces sp. NBC_00853]
MKLAVTEKQAPALGEVRALGSGDELHLMPGWKLRKDWIRYLAAAAHAMARGAQIRQGDE